jgi:hypothetical protein
MKMNNSTNNFNGSNICSVGNNCNCVIKSVRVKLQAEYPQTRLEQKTDTVTNNTTPNPTVIIPAFMKLAQLKP